MQEIVLQLGELFLQAVPTVLIILAFYLMMRALFFKPLLKVMAEREARTAGARKAAQAAEAAAAEKVKHYQEELQQCILELIQDFELKTEWRAEIVAYNPATSTWLGYRIGFYGPSQRCLESRTDYRR